MGVYGKVLEREPMLFLLQHAEIIQRDLLSLLCVAMAGVLYLVEALLKSTHVPL